MITALGAPGRGRGHRRRRGGRRTGAGFVPVSVGTDPFVDLVAQGYKPLPPPPPPPAEVFEVMRGANLLGKFLTLSKAVELAKTASKDGNEVTIKAAGEVIGGFRNGRRTFTTFEGSMYTALGAVDYLNPLSPFSGGLGYYGYRPWRGEHLGRSPSGRVDLEPRRARMPTGGQRPRELPPETKALIDELTSYVRDVVLKMDATEKGSGTPLTMRGFRGLNGACYGCFGAAAPPPGLERLDTVTLRLPQGAIPAVQRVIGQVAQLLRRDPELRQVAAATASRARALLAQGQLIRRTY